MTTILDRRSSARARIFGLKNMDMTRSLFLEEEPKELRSVLESLLGNLADEDVIHLQQP